MNEQKSHDHATDEFLDELMYGTPKDVIDALSKLERLDGIALQILVQQLQGKSGEHNFRNRFRIVGSRGRPPSFFQEPAMLRNLCKEFRRLLDAGVIRKDAIWCLQKRTELSKASIENILTKCPE